MREAMVTNGMEFALQMYAKHGTFGPVGYDLTLAMLGGCTTNEWRLGIALAASQQHERQQQTRSLRIAA